MAVISSPNFDTLREGSFQDILDTAYAALLAQGGPSIDSARNCQYRGENGTKCAIGHFIPDDKYEKAFEGRTVDSSGIRTVLGLQLFTPRLSFLRELQEIHDTAAQDAGYAGPGSIDKWLEIFQQNINTFAAKHKLVSPVSQS